MSRINQEVLRIAREKKHLSLEDLERRSGVDRQTIHRIEKGGQRHNSRKVIDALARALGITEEDLTNISTNSPEETSSDERDELFKESQLNLRVSNQSRNAIALTALRYKVTQSQIVELASLFFCWAAERSLELRRKRLTAIEQNSADLWQLKALHLHARAFNNYQAEHTLDAERQSIATNDIFGRKIDGDSYESYLPDDYSEATDNPFAVFIRELAGEFDGLATFEELSFELVPEYSVCKEQAVTLVGGNEEAANEILDGNVPLFKLPAHLREKGMEEARAKWVRDEANARRQKIATNIKLEDLLD